MKKILCSELFHNVLDIKESADGLIPMRCSERQTEYLATVPVHNLNFRDKSMYGAGCTIELVTNSSNVVLEYTVLCAIADNTRPCNFDLFVDNAFALRIDIDKNIKERQKTTIQISKDGKEHLVAISLSPFCKLVYHQLLIDDESSFNIVPKRKNRMLFIGDSITHGSGSTGASSCYAMQVAKALDIESVNQGIGGYWFDPNYPDYLEFYSYNGYIVAFGTNDWCHQDILPPIEDNMKDFIKAFAKAASGKKVYVITPLRRFLGEGQNDYGPVGFETWRESIKQMALENNFTVLDGYDLLPPEEKWYFDGLHPNDQGYALMAENVIKAII
ncbi:MAG: SGNH/GDSL hydrolase family protein [Sphaerochaetaceae bacterium]|nr:SGNH/GDSL hydrolase family protein [Sphaerochaetaceae bacterium]